APPRYPEAMARRAALADQRLQREQQECQGKGELEAVLEPPLQRARELSLLHRVDVVAGELGDTERRPGGIEGDAARVDGDLLERLLVEARLHQLPGAILEPAARFAGHELALGGADADRVDLDAAIDGALGRLLHIALVVLAVGDEDDRLVAALAALEGG